MGSMTCYLTIIFEQLLAVRYTFSKVFDSTSFVTIDILGELVEIHLAETASEIASCYPVLRELRPHLTLTDLVEQVQRQMKNYGYVLVYVIAQDQVVAVAGYRVAEFLAWGRTFYVDDLVTQSDTRKHGYGGALLDWLLQQAKTLSCNQFHLDSGVTRHDAHRLYLGRKLQISSHHFAVELG